MRPLPVLASALSLLCASAAHAQSESPVSHRWAKAALADAAGQRLLGPLARLYPNFSGPFSSIFSSGSLDEVAFASGARESGMYGLCEAEVIWLTFRRDPETPWTAPANGRAETAPVVVSTVLSETRFRAIADTTSRPWTDPYEAELGLACATQTDGWEFGIADDAVDAWTAVRLQTILPDMAVAQPVALLELLESCVGEDCTAPLSLVPRLRTARFGYAEIESCDHLVAINVPSGSSGPFCLKARYLLNETTNASEWLVVSARFEMRYSADQAMTLDPLILDIRLRHESMIEH